MRTTFHIGARAAAVLALSAAVSAQSCDAPRSSTGVMTYDSARGVAVYHYTRRVDQSERISETWEWDGFDWSKRAETGPQIVGTGFVFDTRRNKTVMPVGHGSVYEWDGEEWTGYFGVGPGWSLGQAAAYDSVRGVTVINVEDSWHLPGGPGTFEWDGQSITQINYTGPYRSGHSLVFDEARGHSLLFGGGKPAYPPVYNNELWSWDGTQWSLIMTGGPSPRGTAMAYDAAREVVVLFGGWSGTEFFNDTWEWNGQEWSLRATTGPSPRWSTALAYDSVREVTVLVGGWQPGGLSGETWEWDGQTWTLRHTKCYADCDTSTGCDTLDIFDFLCFQNSFVWRDRYACDCDTNTGPDVCDIFDFLCFQNAFVAGCK